MNISWCLWYDDSHFTSEDGDWFDAPFRGVLGLTVRTVHGWRVLLGEHYGITRWNDLPVPLDVWGVMDTLDLTDVRPADVTLVELDRCGIKIGRYLDDEAWHAVRSHIMKQSAVVMGCASGGRSYRVEAEHREVVVHG